VGSAIASTADLVPIVPPASEGSDDLTRIKGLGPKIAEQLAGLGVTTFAQIAAWDEAEIDRIDAQLGRFQGRIRRDDWPAQAKLLAAGDTAGYEAAFGRL
jgi:predicted flap endonuclease-1-like 5' DNA nuclease